MTRTVARSIAALCLAVAAAPPARASHVDFSHWLEEFAIEAQQRGISRSVIDGALLGVEPLPDVIDLDRRQPEVVEDFCSYLSRRLSSARIERGRRMLEKHGELLRRVSARYGVPARFLVALWGLETNFGDITGSFQVIDALATLAHDDRRSALFREQLFAALRIVDQGHRTPSQLTGSWAGGMGHVQLMPTTFLENAVDYDGDGSKNIWSSLPDSFASAATYLKNIGWRQGETWGREVWLPAALARDRAQLSKTRTIAEWRSAGVTRIDGSALPGSGMRGSIVLPDRENQYAFLVYSNFHTIMRWNRSTFFAISVGALADEISRSASLRACRS